MSFVRSRTALAMYAHESAPCGAFWGDRWGRPAGREADVPEWRNWQTRWIQNPVPARACGFESHLWYLLPCVRFAGPALGLFLWGLFLWGLLPSAL